MTGFIRRHWRFIFRSIGTLLVLTGLYAAYLWFYKLGPCYRYCDPEWYCKHSEAEYWQEVQSSIHRGMWIHDEAFVVGTYGDKTWAKWIIDHLDPGQEMGCVKHLSHSHFSLCYITNQDVGNISTPWFDWWRKNGSKSQEEWIADGFELHGLHVDIPPTAEQTKALLLVLADSSEKDKAVYPECFPYNAFRWLRDSGFDPVEYALSNQPISDEIARGLRRYSEYQKAWPSALELGILSFGKTPYDPDEHFRPRIYEPEFQTAAYAIIFLPLIIGIGLFLLSFREPAAVKSNL